MIASQPLSLAAERPPRTPVIIVTLAACLLATSPVRAQQSVGELKQMTLQQLLEVDVSLVSRRPESLFGAAAAIQVITREDILRAGAQTVPEVLQRLALHLEVAQLNAHDWAISARGFNGAPLTNNSMSDKLLVMIDGRTVYSPLFGGVFWDAQHVLLEDVERIEIVAGPGGTLWGANAVNGVVNVVTRSARATKGWYASAGGGSFVERTLAARFGGDAGEHVSYRLYGQRLDFDHLRSVTGVPINDRWDVSQGGVRLDFVPSASNSVTLQGDAYQGDEGRPTSVALDGQNLLFRWRRAPSARSDFQVQIYYDRTSRRLPTNTFSDEMQTYDIDVQHRSPLTARHSLLWGAGYRSAHDASRNSPTLAFDPESRRMQRGSAFVQDEIALLPDRLTLAVGAKLEHDTFSGWNLQPSVRTAWTPTGRQTLWAAISRAVHPPSRFDADVVIPLGSDPAFTSEKLTAYEVGFRTRPLEKVSVAVATFYNRYTDVRSINVAPLRFANQQRARTGGLELSGRVEVAAWWRLNGGYSYLRTALRPTAADVFPGSAEFEAVDPNHQVKLQSVIDMPLRFQLDVAARYVGALPASSIIRSRATPSYGTFTVRLAKHVKQVELSIVGRNLAEPRHTEFGSAEIPRSVMAHVTWRR